MRRIHRHGVVIELIWGCGRIIATGAAYSVALPAREAKTLSRASDAVLDGRRGQPCGRPLPATPLTLQLAQEILGTDQVVVEDLAGGFEKVSDQWVAYRVADAHALLPP